MSEADEWHKSEVFELSHGRARVGESTAGEKSGRGLFAARDFAAGEVVLSESAYFGAPEWHSYECVCHFCLRREGDDDEFEQCKVCKWSRFCSDKCRASHVARFHGRECAAMAACKLRTLDAPATAVLAARILLDRNVTSDDSGKRGEPTLPPDADYLGSDRAQLGSAGANEGAEGTAEATRLRAFQRRAADLLVGWTKEIPESWVAAMADTVAVVRRLIGEGCSVSDPDIVQVLCQLQRNQFQVLDDRDAVAAIALYPLISMLNHSCDPNLRPIIEHGFGLDFVALRDISSGEELVFSYVPLDAPKEERYGVLRHKYLFECCCPRCLSEANGAGKA